LVYSIEAEGISHKRRLAIWFTRNNVVAGVTDECVCEGKVEKLRASWPVESSGSWGK
jgi:hypothetical protein